ncbi:MAG: hypothetical protein JW996_03535, partial [Candidatus Cloacimonetes bacterium]|nr:hypothetical protein [Candidatus Cloacimonadota bacterium]
MKISIQISLIVFACSFFCADYLMAEIIEIPGDHDTIQEGIDVALNGDIVVVSPATYYENINFKGKNILLTSHFYYEQDPCYIEETVIDGIYTVNTDSMSTVIFCNGEDENAVLQGFTIRGGGGTSWIDPQFPSYTWFSGGGIFIYMASPTIRNNLITSNIVVNDGSYDGASGGGLLSFRGNPLITNNEFSWNQADYGAGIVVDYSGAIIKNNVVRYNSGGQLYGGGGFYTIGNDVNPIIVENNTIVFNHSETTGGAFRFWSSSATSRNNIIWGNTQNSGGPIDGGGASSFSYCDVEGGIAGEGNIDEYPDFSDMEIYILSEDSPCVDAGDPDYEFNDPEDPQNPGEAQYPAQGSLRNDMGAFGGPLSIFWEYTSSKELQLPSPVFNLYNYPNPFSVEKKREEATTISFELSGKADITLSIFNL